MKTISVLIPVFKPGEYIDNCFKSLDKQTLSKDKFTVYVALNGPKENYESLLINTIKKYYFQYQYYYLKKKGVSNARNYLLENSKEPYVVFLDDDYISECYLEDLLEKSQPNSIVVSNFFDVRENTVDILDNYINKCYKSIKEEENSKFKARSYFSIACAKIIPREVIGDTKFDERLAIGEDSLFMAQISPKIKKIIKSDEQTCYFRVIRSGSALRRKRNKIDEIKRIFYLLKKYTFMLFRKDFEKLFVLSRLAATIMHFRRVF